MLRYALRYGAIVGLVLCLLMFATTPLWKEDMNMRLGEILGLASMVAALSAVFFGVKAYRDREQAGYITFGQAFGVGLAMVVVASVIYVLGWMVYYNTLGQDFPDQYFQYMVGEIETSDRSPEEKAAEIAQMKSQMENYRQPVVMMGFTFLEIFPIGLLVALICAALLRRKSPAVVDNAA